MADRKRTNSSCAAVGNSNTQEHQASFTERGLGTVDEVEMAQDELFAGPIAESLPSSASAFSHHRACDSIRSSFAFHEGDLSASIADLRSSKRRRSTATSDRTHAFTATNRRDDDQSPYQAAFDDAFDAESQSSKFTEDSVPRRFSLQSRAADRTWLLRQHNASFSHRPSHAPCNQTIYMENEDMTIAISGFRTSFLGILLYVVLCVFSGGLAYLILRWFPRWYIKIVGCPCNLADCMWVVVENQWKEVAILPVKAQRFGRPVSLLFGEPDGVPFHGLDDEESDPIIDTLRTLDYRYVRLYFHPLEDRFLLLNGWKDPEWTTLRTARQGLDSDEKVLRNITFERNVITIEEKPTLHLLVDEVIHPFYMFQLASLVLWSLDSYYYYAVCIFTISVGSITTTLLETRATIKRLRKISHFECDVRVLRNGFWGFVASSDLVPGDIYELSDPNLNQIPCDSLLLSGDCIVNESMLTGESIPVSKSPAVDEILRSMDVAASSVSPEVARHFLFAGTKIIRARRPKADDSDDAASLALTIRTGFNTTKGALIRSMLFPKPSTFKFYRDSFRYISVMTLVAILGFIVSVVNFVRMELAWHVIVVRALDLITIVVPPALPATLTIGTNFALARLKSRNIFCISPQRVNVGGKIDIMCFDKTGTLTEDGLDVLGMHASSPESKRFGNLIPTAPLCCAVGAIKERLHPLQAMLFTMTTCHSLRFVDGHLIGDPLDVKMFAFTDWSFEEGKQPFSAGENTQPRGLTPSIARPPDDSFELGILKTFEFVPQLRRASVVVRRFGHKHGDIFVKGAPEVMREICRLNSLPEDFDELLSYYTHRGYRVIGCASKHLHHLSWLKAQKMTRSETESDLEFAGFIIFENKLKPTTTGILRELTLANISTVMVTGDNILTAISVARECRLLDPNIDCFVPRFVTGDMYDPMAVLRWENIDDCNQHLDGSSLLPLTARRGVDISCPYAINATQKYALAVSGDVFRWIVDFAPEEILHRTLVLGKVFARMSPDEKHELVEKLQSIDYCCGFCGDGANDCGALTAADVGISLSDAEASVAAPFTSREFNTQCVLDVIREGRAALVTSFSCFKYMSMYSAIQFTTVSFLYANASNLGDFQFLFIDLLLILPIAILIGRAEPAAKLCRRRPTADLVSRKVLTPLLTLMTLSLLVQGITYVTVREQPWYIAPQVDRSKTSIRNSDNTALFSISCFQYVLCGIILNAGPPFRERMDRNWPLMITISTALVTSLYIMFNPARWVAQILELTQMGWDYCLFLAAMTVMYFLIAWSFENRIAVQLAGALEHMVRCFIGPKKRKRYKVIVENL